MLSASPHKSRQQAGFTLLEVMVVIAIMGLVASIVIPFFPGGKKEQMSEAADHFEARIAFVQTQAVLQSQDLGLAIEGINYHFLQRVQSGWKVIEEEPLESQKVKDFLTQRLLIEEQEFIPEELDEEGAVSAPGVLFFSSGEITPFTYQLALSEETYVNLSYDPLGEVKREYFDETQ